MRSEGSAHVGKVLTLPKGESRAGTSSGLQKENVMSGPDIQLVQELRKHALALRTLAYALPTGWGAHEVHELANRLVTFTDRLAARKAAERLIRADEVAT